MSNISKVKLKMTCCNISGVGGNGLPVLFFPLLQKQIPRAWSKAIFHHQAPVERQGTSPQCGLGSRSSDPKAIWTIAFLSWETEMHTLSFRHFSPLRHTRRVPVSFLSVCQPHAPLLCVRLLAALIISNPQACGETNLAKEHYNNLANGSKGTFTLN